MAEPLTRAQLQASVDKALAKIDFLFASLTFSSSVVTATTAAAAAQPSAENQEAPRAATTLTRTTSCSSPSTTASTATAPAPVTTPHATSSSPTVPCAAPSPPPSQAVPTPSPGILPLPVSPPRQPPPVLLPRSEAALFPAPGANHPVELTGQTPSAAPAASSPATPAATSALASTPPPAAPPAAPPSPPAFVQLATPSAMPATSMAMPPTAAPTPTTLRQAAMPCAAFPAIPFFAQFTSPVPGGAKLPIASTGPRLVLYAAPTPTSATGGHLHHRSPAFQDPLRHARPHLWDPPHVVRHRPQQPVHASRWPRRPAGSLLAPLNHDLPPHLGRPPRDLRILTARGRAAFEGGEVLRLRQPALPTPPRHLQRNRRPLRFAQLCLRPRMRRRPPRLVWLPIPRSGAAHVLAVAVTAATCPLLQAAAVAPAPAPAAQLQVGWALCLDPMAAFCRLVDGSILDVTGNHRGLMSSIRRVHSSGPSAWGELVLLVTAAQGHPVAMFHLAFSRSCQVLQRWPLLVSVLLEEHHGGTRVLLLHHINLVPSSGDAHACVLQGHAKLQAALAQVVAVSPSVDAVVLIGSASPSPGLPQQHQRHHHDSLHFTTKSAALSIVTARGRAAFEGGEVLWPVGPALGP